MESSGAGGSGTKGKAKHVLEEDLQFSSEEEDAGMSDSGGAGGGLVAAGEPLPDDDSQQAAEAMVQLGNMGYYPAQGAAGAHPNEHEGTQFPLIHFHFSLPPSLAPFLKRNERLFIIEATFEIASNPFKTHTVVFNEEN